MKTNTVLSQIGIKTDSATGSLATPIYQSATFSHSGIGKSTGYDYSRTKNPTRTVLEEAIAKLENGTSGFAFSTGMAALTAVFGIFKSDSHFIVSDDLYGGTYRLFQHLSKNFNFSFSYVPTSSLESVKKAFIKNKTVAVFIETPSNPLMKITDLSMISEFCKTNNILSIADNTFMTPYYQRPLDNGFDIVVHSGTKYLSGHNDTLSGFVVTKNNNIGEEIGFIQNTTGAVLSPFDSFLMLRSLKTLAIRMDRIEENSKKVSSFLNSHKNVKKVFYPHLDNFSHKDIHFKQSTGGGGIISIYLNNYEAVKKIINSVKVFTFAESLGGVESLITYPRTQTHGAIPIERQEEIGITESLVRLSIGIEDADDLIEDLDRFL